jgi:hypothetical protein
MNIISGRKDDVIQFAIRWSGIASGWFHRRSLALVAFLEIRMSQFAIAWVTAVLLIGTAKIVFAPIAAHDAASALAMFAPYLLIAIAPVLGYVLAAACFPRDHLSPQPSIRLCRYGRWRDLDLLSARTSDAFGPAGFVASLLAGLILNVPFRCAEFLLAVPAVGLEAPAWAHILFHAMAADLVIMSFLYMVCFVMALRSVPLFPRMMLFCWLADIVMQFGMARMVSGAPDLPPAVARSLLDLLDGNIHKVLISVAVWLPYLVLSERVNLTFRGRIRA